MAPKPFIIECSSSSSDLVGASSRAIHSLVNLEEEVSSQVRQTYSYDDDCVIIRETWNNREMQENDDCVIVGENWQIGSSSTRKQPVCNLQTSQPQEDLRLSSPPSAQAAQPSSSGTQRPRHAAAAAAAPVAQPPSPYVPKGYLVIRRPLANQATCRRATSSSSSTESDGTCYGDAPLSDAAQRPNRNLVIRTPQGGRGGD